MSYNRNHHKRRKASDTDDDDNYDDNDDENYEEEDNNDNYDNDDEEEDNDKYHHYKRRQKCDSEYWVDTKTQNGRRKISKLTLRIISEGQNFGKYTVLHRNGSVEHVDISRPIRDSILHTKTFPPQYFNKEKHPFKPPKPPGNMCQIEVVSNTTFGAARDLIQKDGYSKTCVLNFGSATKPGGGFLNGRQAQEECLSRQSALYATIKDSVMYSYNATNQDDFFNDYMIYSPNVPVFRGPFRERLLCKNDVYYVSVITSAAPNMTSTEKKSSINPMKWFDSLSAEKKMRKRIKKILFLAIEQGNEAIVLGAYGCGVFKNSPGKVSKAFKSILVEEEQLGRYFKKVVFAILGDKSDNFIEFKKTFDPNKH